MTPNSATENHERWMRRCLQLARCGQGHAAPNPMVGAVIVHEGRIIGEAITYAAARPTLKSTPYAPSARLTARCCASPRSTSAWSPAPTSGAHRPAPASS